MIMYRDEKLHILYIKLCNKNLTKFEVFIKNFLKENKSKHKMRIILFLFAKA